MFLEGGLGVGAATTTKGVTETSGDIFSGGDIIANNSGTSTIRIQSTTSTRGGCIEFENAAGTAYFRLYATSSVVAVFETGRCK